MNPMRTTRHIIYIPGLGNSGFGCMLLRLRLGHQKFAFHILRMYWGDGGTFESKLNKTLQKVDELTQNGDKVSIVGSSAGGTMAANAFLKLPDKIERVITISSPLTTGGQTRPRLERTDHGIPVVKAALAELDAASERLTPTQRSNVMIMRPFYDQVVPTASMFLKGAHIKTFFGFMHFLNLVIAQLFYARDIADFLNVPSET